MSYGDHIVSLSLSPAKLVLDLATPEGRKAELTYFGIVVYRDGILWYARRRYGGRAVDVHDGSGLRREYGSRRPCSCTMPLIELRRQTWVNWFVSSICLVDVPCALLGPIVCWCRPWNCLPSAAGPSRSPDPPSGIACRTTWCQPRLCQPSVSV